MTYLFGDCELDPGLHELRKCGCVSAVEPKVFDLLVYLIENRDRLVGKDELNQRIWNGQVVSDASLSTCMKLARQAIGDSGKKQEFIRTIPRRGFRFVGNVKVRGPSHPAFSDERIGPTGPAQPNSSANNVSRLENENGHSGQDHVAHGIAADIATILSRRANLSPFVGRRTELRQFEDILNDCLEAGLGQTVFIKGEAGIGKTRLAEEFQTLAEDRGFKTYAGRVLNFGVGEGQDAIRGLVRCLLELSPETNEKTRAAVAETVTRTDLILPDHRVHLYDLLDLYQPADLRSLYDAMNNETRNNRERETVAQLVRSRFRETPVLLKIEDLQWADRIVLDHVTHLANAVANGPAVLVITSRIEGEQIDPAWQHAIEEAPLRTIDLGPLRDTEAMELAQDFMDMTSQITRAYIERAGGNPLYLEQLLRSAEEGIAEAVSGSMQSLVQARVDRLKPSDRNALQAASVLGQRFSLKDVQHIIGQTEYPTDRLVAQGLVRPEGYSFTHALIRDGVYTSLPINQRRELHRRAAAWFKDRDLILYAEHLDWAGDEKAAEAYLAAAQQQRGMYRYERALQLVNKALVIQCAPSVKFELICYQGTLFRELGEVDRSIQAFEQAHGAATTSEQACRADVGLAEGMRIVDRYDEALEALDRAQTVATEHCLVPALAQIHYLRGSLYFPLGNVDGCLKEHEKARIFARQANSAEHEARALSGLADAYYMRGRMRSASHHYQKCIEISREDGFGRIEVANLNMLGLANLYQIRLKSALEFTRAGAETAAKVGHLRAEGNAWRTTGHILYEMGEYERAQRQYELALDLARRIGSGRFEANSLIGLGKVLAAKNQTFDAVTHLERAISLCNETGVTFAGPWALGALAAVTDDAGTRNRALEQGETILRCGCVGHNHFWFYRFAIEACLDSRDWDEVERYAQALEDYTRPEPLPWTDFFIARGRMLAGFERGQRDEGTVGDLYRLSVKAKRTGMMNALHALERALTDYENSS